MERVSFEIGRQDVADALAAEAAAHGRSVEQEVVSLIERTYGAKPRHIPDFQRVLDVGHGLDFTPPPRQKFIVDEPDL